MVREGTFREGFSYQVRAGRSLKAASEEYRLQFFLLQSCRKALPAKILIQTLQCFLDMLTSIYFNLLLGNRGEGGKRAFEPKKFKMESKLKGPEARWNNRAGVTRMLETACPSNPTQLGPHPSFSPTVSTVSPTETYSFFLWSPSPSVSPLRCCFWTL